MRLILLPLSMLLLPFHCGAQVRAVVPASGPAPVGPYSPGISAGDYLYVSGQGAHGPDGSMPDTFAGQVRQALENVKAVVEAGGLTMDHVVYTQVYLEDMGKFEEMNAVYAQHSRKRRPHKRPSVSPNSPARPSRSTLWRFGICPIGSGFRSRP